MKRFYSIAVLVIFVLILVACGSASGQPTEEPAVIETQKETDQVRFFMEYAKEPTCALIEKEDVRDIQFVASGKYGDPVTIIVTNELQPILIREWAGFEAGWYLYESAPITEVFLYNGMYIGTRDQCPTGANVIE